MKKNKVLLRIGVVCAILVAFYLVARFSGGLRFYQTPTSGNSPGIEPNDYIIVSNWVSYKRFDFVCYEAEDPYIGPSIFTHRLCGLPGDTIQIINGELFVNGRNADKSLNVKHKYIISRKESYKIRELDGVEYLGQTSMEWDSVYLAIAASDIQPEFGVQRVINDTYGSVHQQFPSEWTMDNFGPLILKGGEVFLLGDNRDNSIDSRNYGLAHESDITGVILNKE